MSKDYPFSVEYAKSNRSACKGCRGLIAKDALRLGIMIQSVHFDGMVPLWYHEDCFWMQGKSNQLKSEADIYHFDLLRWEDQEALRERIQKGGKGRAYASAVSASPKANIEDFQIEVSRNSSAKCRECGDKILKDDLRVGRQSRGAKTVLWHHLSCFAEKKEKFGFKFDPQNVRGYDQLEDGDRNLVRDKLKSPKRAHENGGESDETTAKRMKLTGNDAQSDEEKLKAALKKQTDDLWQLRDKLTANLTKKEIAELLRYNNQTVPSGDAKVLDRLTECMLFGVPEPCTECGGGQIVFSSSNNCYVCTGHVSGFTTCQYSTKTPKRRAFLIPEEYQDNPFLSSFVFKPGRERAFPITHRIATIQGSPALRPGVSSMTAPTKPLLHLKFVLLPNIGNDVKEKIRELGGVIVLKTTTDTVAVIAPKTNGTYTGEKGDGKEIVAAKKANVHVVSEDFMDDIKNSGVADAVEKHKLCDWGSDVMIRITNCRAPETSSKSGRSGKSGSKSMPFTQKVVIKGGVAVDPESEHADVAHVYRDKNDGPFTTTLGRADVQMGSNSYYKLQLLEHDNSKKYWLYRAWGRIGAPVGGTKEESYGSDLEAAKDEFKRLYYEKTGNEWEYRNNFVKKPYLYYPMDIDYGESDEPTSSVKAGSKSKLPRPVQDLVKLIFDIEQMKQTMKEFEIDLTKMPLGKLSKKQIQSAYAVLTELQEALRGAPNRAKILDCTNRFFTLVPHDFGLNPIPLLDNADIVKEKTMMLDNLLEIEVAYSILKGDTGDRDPIDAHYEKLNTDLDVLDKTSKEFQMIQEYVKNTHAATHSHYELEIEEVFLTNRHGEKDRYAQFKDLNNRMLLWHGSRTSNYAGILSQGLRIAPPEAPSTGYMFGKGIYFADMVSKSANYCYTTVSNPTGLVLLSEVALGNMQELTNAQMVTKLPDGIHSVKGIGKTAPDPTQAIASPDGTLIPLGKGTDTNVGATTLLYNEYIVYDVAQVNIKYLVKLRFKYKV